MEEQIRSAVLEAMGDSGAGVSFVVERPTTLSHGDFTTNAALVAAKLFDTNPRTLAEQFAPAIQTRLGDIVSSVTVAGPGFINITLSHTAIHNTLIKALSLGEGWGKGKEQEGQRVMVEYTQPNPFKEMHIGHLMSNIIGESIARLIANAGAQVAHANYQGDVGLHVAKALWGLSHMGILEPETASQLGEAYTKGSRAYEEDTKAKAEIDVLNQEIYAGTNHEVMERWRKGSDVSLEAFERLYRILGTHFDYYFFESETAESGLRIVKDGLAKGVYEESNGAVIYPGEKRGLHTLVFITSKGTPTYEAKDIALAFLKEERWPSDRSLILTAAEQIGHFKVVLAALAEIAPQLAEKTTHVPNGFLRLTTGKMSSREGNVVTAAEFIDDVVASTSERNTDPVIAEQVAVGAIKYMILRQGPGQDIIFDKEKSLSLQGDSGSYLQYALVRAQSILNRHDDSPIHPSTDTELSSESYPIERLLIHFPAAAARSARELAPNLLVNYLTELAAAWNTFYAQERIIGGTHEEYKLMLARVFVLTMKNGLSLLGIPTPTRM